MARGEITFDLNRPFAEALAYARARRVVLPEVYYGQLQGVARSRAFSIAGVAQLEILTAVHASLAAAIESGESFEKWKKRVAAGDAPLELAPHRLDNVFRTNIQAAYGRGRGEQQRANRRARPYLMYDAINDSRTRPAHAAMDGFIAPWGDAVWKVWRPPAGFRCRCTVIALTEAQARDRGYPMPPRAARPDAGWDYDRMDAAASGVREAAARAVRKAPAKLARPAKRAIDAADALDPSTWRALPGTQRGSNEGGLYEAPDGTRYYVKFPRDANQARSEVAAARVYDLLGIETVRPELVTIAGRTGIASRFRDDWKRVSAADIAKHHAEDAARIYQASVLTKNWDFVGAALDNLMVTPQGRLAIVDTGAAFKFRAQGGAKPFGPDIDEVRTFRRHGRNEAAPIFGPLFDADVYLEQRGARPVLALEAARVAAELERVGFSPAEVRELSATLTARREALVDRYDLDGRHTPKTGGEVDLAALRDEFAAMVGRARHRDVQITDTGAHRSRAADAEFAGLVRKFEARAAKIHPNARGQLQHLFRKQWSGDSSSLGGAVIKQWAAKRFKVKAGFHKSTGGAAADVLVNREAAEYLAEAAKRGTPQAKVFALLDAEWAFHQAVLRRVHGWDAFEVERGMNAGEARTLSGEAGQWTPNAAISTAVGRVGGFLDKPERLRIEARVEHVLKSWAQGADYMSFYDGELEYVLLGVKTRARRLKKASRYVDWSSPPALAD